MNHEDVRVRIEAFLGSQELELVEFQPRSESGATVFRLLADKPRGGITMDECGRVNRALCALFDQEGICAGNYSLEVFSPGLDRPLASAADLRRNLGRKAKFFLKQQIDGKIEWDGLISNVSEGQVDVQTDKGLLQIPLPLFHKAKLLFND